jgi:two-component system CheB/CheR fusion protein
MLDLVLKTHSKLKVVEATPDASIENDKVYYAPPAHYVTITDGTLQFVPREEGPINRSIDMFLESLAQNENKRKAIAVIFSGTGSDGVKGVAALKKAGGLVIVQNPESCEYADLPLKIIQSGNADFVLEPEDMPVVIQGYANRYVYNAEPDPLA